MADESQDRPFAEAWTNIRRQFLSAMRAGEQPQSERYVEVLPPAQRPAALRELLELELAWRHQESRTELETQYVARLPEHETSVRQLLRDSEAKPDGAKTECAPPSAGNTQAWPPVEEGASTLHQARDASLATSRPRSLPAGELTLPCRFGDYELLEELGKGGMGVVYKARQLSANRLVALKLIRPDQLSKYLPEDRRQVLARFRNEVQAAAQLEHDHVVTVYDVGETDGQSYYAMRLVEGQSLKERLADGPLEPMLAARYVQQVASALAEAHARGILHRDLKPHNVMLDRKTDRALLADFGLAKLTSGDQHLTATEAVMGSPPYMSPEQAVDAGKVTAASDIYGLGATLYHLLTGRPPFQAADAIGTLLQVQTKEPISPRELNPAVPRDLDTICLKCLEKTPAKRYLSALEVADRLARVQRGEPIPERPIGRVEKIRRWRRKNPWIAGLSAAVAGVLVMGIVVSSLLAVLAANHSRVAEVRAQQLGQANVGLAAKTRDLEAANQNLDAERRNVAAANQGLSAALADLSVAKQRAERGEAAAKTALTEAQQQLRKFEVMDYITRIKTADQALDAFDYVAAREQLHACRDDLRGPEHDYLAHQLERRQPQTLQHSGRIHGLVESTDGRWLVSGSNDFTIKVWDLNSRTEVRTLRGHAEWITSLAISSDGRWLYSGSADKTIKVWDLRTGENTRTLLGHTGWVRSVALSADNLRLCSASDDQTIKVWELPAGTEAHTLRGHTGGVNSLAISPDGQTLYSGSADKTIRKWDLAAAKESSSFTGHRYGVSNVVLSADGNWLCSASTRMIKVWDTMTGKEQHTLHGHAHSVVSLALSPDGKRLYSSGNDKTIMVWNLVERKLSHILHGHSKNVWSVALSHDGQRLYSGDDAGAINLWNLEVGGQTHALSRHIYPVWCLKHSADGDRLYSGSEDKTVNIWDVASGNAVRTLQGHLKCAHCLASSRDDRTLCSGSCDSTIKVWDLQTGTNTHTLQGHTNRVTCLALSADGRRLYSGSWDHTIKVWDMQDGTEIHTLRGHVQGVRSLALSADGRRLFSGSDDDTIKIWDLEAGKDIATLRGHTDNVITIVLSADERSLYSGSQDSTIKVWDLATEKELRTLHGHTNSVECLALSTDGRTLYSASGDHTIKFWDLELGQEMLSLKGHADTIWSLALSPNGRRLYSGASDGTIRVWVLKADESDDWLSLPTIADGDAAKQLQATFATQHRLPLEKTNSLRMTLRLIPSGRLEGEGLAGKPKSLAVTDGFYLSAHEVTIAQFREFVKATDHRVPTGTFGYDQERGGAYFKDEHSWEQPSYPVTDQHPVVIVDHAACDAFCRWLSEKEKAVYRLPTDVEWEFAARAGATGRYSSGDDVASLEGVGNFADASFARLFHSTAPARLDTYVPWDDGYPFTAPVGSFQANAFGLFDMHGNAEERVIDAPSGRNRCAGGSFYRGDYNAQSAYRRYDIDIQPTTRMMEFGLRIVREIAADR